MSCLRTSGVKLRTVSCSLHSSPMMLCFVPPWMDAHGHHGRLDRLHLAAHDRLQVEHQPRGDDDRVDRRVRVRPVAAAAVDRDVHAVDVGQRIAGPRGNAGRSRGPPPRAGPAR